MKNQVLIPVASYKRLDEATEAIQNRSLLFNKDTNILSIKYNDELRPIAGAGAGDVSYNIGSTIEIFAPDLDSARMRLPETGNWAHVRTEYILGEEI